MPKKLETILPSIRELHPALFALYPIVFFYSINIDQTTPAELLVPISVSLLVAAVIYLLAVLATGNPGKSSISTTWLLLMIFSYGHVFYSVQDLVGGQNEAAKHRGFALVWVILFGTVLLGIQLSRSGFPRSNRFLSVVGVALTAMAVGSIIIYPLTLDRAAGKVAVDNIEAAAVTIDTDPPNVFYIILDGYARHDTLSELYGFDNSDFIGFLEQKGFFVAKKSTSNYNQTSLSLASALNLDYIQNLLPNADPSSSDKSPLEGSELRRAPVIQKIVSKRGYRFVTFDSGYSGTELGKSDLFQKAPGSLSEFQSVLLKTTAVAAVLGPIVKSSDFQYESRRNSLVWTLEHIPDMAKNKAPVFVFSHIMAPHPPFVFGPNGERNDPGYVFDIADGSAYFSISGTTKDGYIKGYRGQLQYINKLVENAVDKILSESEEPAIIIIQSDHGPGSRMHHNDPNQTDLNERMSNFSAVFFPDQDYSQLYDSITPINSLRVVVNKFFQETPLLEDKSYFAPWIRPYLYFDVTEQVQ